MKFREGDVVRLWDNVLGDYETGVIKLNWFDKVHNTQWYKIEFQRNDGVIDTQWHSEIFLARVEKKKKEDLM